MLAFTPILGHFWNVDPKFIGECRVIFLRVMRPPMPLYFFHFSVEKRTFIDRIGVELDGMADARKNAIAQIREMRGAQSEHALKNWAAWKMIVGDAKGKTLFEVGFDLSTKSMDYNQLPSHI